MVVSLRVLEIEGPEIYRIELLIALAMKGYAYETLAHKAASLDVYFNRSVLEIGSV